MVMTSPPYWALRNYKTSAQIWDGDKDCEHEWLETNFCNSCAAWKGELGNEPTFELYIKHLCDIFDEIKRVLKDDGSIYVNIGDTYASSGGASRLLGYSDPKYPNGRCGNFEEPNTYKQNGVKPKSLCMIPSRFAIEMCNRGFILRNEIVWHRPNQMPQSASDRFTVDFEKLLFFTKNEKYYFKQQFEPYTSPIDRWGGEQVKEYEGKYTELNSMNAEDSGSPRARNIRIGYPERERSLRPNALGRNKRTVWSINTKPFKDAHFATFCTEICKTPIDASCPSEICTKCGKPKIMKYDKIESGDDRTNRPFGHSGNNDRNDIGNIYIQKDTIEIGTIPSCDCNESFEPGIVLDPFMGSGTTAIESIAQFKNWIGIELNPLYIEIAEKRIAEEFPYYNNSSLLEL